MHRFRRASAGPAGATKEGSAHAGGNSQRSLATTAPVTPASSPFTSGNNETTDEPVLNESGKRAVPSPPSSTGFFSNRHRSATPTPRVPDGDNANPFAALKHGSGNADSAPERQPPAASSSLWRGDAESTPDRQLPAPSSSVWRGDAPPGAVARARGAPSAPADAEEHPVPPVPSPPCFRFPSAAGKRQPAPLPPTASFGKEHDRPSSDNSTTSTNNDNNNTNNRINNNSSNINNTSNNNSNKKNASGHGPSPGGPTPPNAIMNIPHPKSATTHQPRGAAAQPRDTAAPRAEGNTRGDGQQGRARSSSVGEGVLDRCAPRSGADMARHNDSSGSAVTAKGPRLRDERQAPAMPTTTGGSKEPRCSTLPSPSLSNGKGAGAAGVAVAAMPPSSQLDTVMEDYDPFDDLSVAEGAIFADASARIQKLRRRQLSVREGFARSHFRLLQGDAGFKIHADAEHLVASTLSLLQEMNLEADAAPGDEDRSQQV